MNVKELKDILKDYADGIPVVVDGYETGYDDPHIEVSLIKPNPSGFSSCEGKYDDASRETYDKARWALVIGRGKLI